MKFYPSALSVVLGACLLSSSSIVAFLHSKPTRISTLSIPRYNRQQQPQRTSLFESPDSSSHSSLISQLAFYPAEETLSERLKNVQTEFDTIKKEGIGKFFSDELEAAEKIIKGNADKASKGAAEVISKGESDDYLLKDGFHSMVDVGKKLANEMMEVRQEFDELKAAKIVEEAAEDVVSTDVLMEKDLAKVVENVVASLEDAEQAVQAAIAVVASKEGLTDAAKSELTGKLESKAQNIEESIKVADSVAKTAKQIAVEDEKVMAELEKTGDRLSAAIDATESLTDTLKGTEGGASIDAVSNTVDAAAAIVKEDLTAAESIADAVGAKVVMEADAVMAMDERAAGSVEAVRAAKSSISESSGEDSESLASALTKDAKEIKVDEDTAEKLAEAISKDAANDEEALEVLERSSSEVKSLINAVDDAVEKAADATTNGSEASKGSVTEAVGKIEKEVKEVEGSMTDVEKAAEDCEDCKVKKFNEEVKADETSSSDSVKEEVVVENKQSEVEETGAAEEPVTEKKDESVSETKAEVKKEEEVKEEMKTDRKPEGEDKAENEVEVSSSEVEDEKVETVAQSEPSQGVDDSIEKASSDESIPTTSAEDVGSADNDAGGMIETASAGESVEAPTTIASADHDAVESIGEAVASTADGAAQHDAVTDAVEMASNSIGADDLAETIASADPPEGMGEVVASAGDVLSEIGDSLSSSSDSVHDVATSTTEALAEAVAVVTSLFM